MRRVWLSKEDFGLFHQDITPQEFEFFRSHAGAFKRMWNEQTRRFWSLFVNAFEHFIWNYGIMKDFPMTVDEAREYIDEIMFYVRDQFVDGRISTAKALVMDCVIVTQNRHCIAQLDKAAYAQNPFYMKETREVFRQLFGPPSHKKTFMKVLCGLPVYVKFAGAAVACLRRWLSADSIPPDEKLEAQFLDNVHRRKLDKLAHGYGAELLAAVGRLDPKPAANTSAPVRKPASTEPSKAIDSKSSQNSVGTAGDNDEQGVPLAKKKRKKKKKKSSQDSMSGETPTTVEGGELAGEGRGKKDLEKCCGNEIEPREDSDNKKEIGDDKVQLEELNGLKETKTNAQEADTECRVKDPGEDRAECDGFVGRDKTGVDDCSGGSACSSPNSTTDSGISSVGGVEPVAKEDNVISEVDVLAVESLEVSNEVGETSVTKEVSFVANEESAAKEADARKRKLHLCACCGGAETVAKSFKRCQKCKGLPNPKYYCNRECQAKHWKEHKLDHKEDGTEAAAT